MRGRRLLSLLVALAGAALLALTVRRDGWSEVAGGIANVGWAFLLVIALGAARLAVRARAWIICARSGSNDFRFSAALRAMLAADALGNLTPLGLLASEPTKIVLARGALSTVTSIASVTIENGFYTASVVLVLLVGTWFFVQRADVPVAIEGAAEIVVAGALVAGVVLLWLARARPAVLSRVEPLLSRLVGRATTSRDVLKRVEAEIYDVLHWPVGRLGHAAVWEVAFHLCAVLEVWLVLRLLPGGSHAGVIDAFLMETAGRFVTVTFKFIPYRLGIDEAGSGVVAQLLGFGAATGVALALVRRLRILVLNAFGLLVLARTR
jgi:hypothetical protein